MMILILVLIVFKKTSSEILKDYDINGKSVDDVNRKIQIFLDPNHTQEDFWRYGFVLTQNA